MMWQVWPEKANVSEPLMTCRKALGDTKTGVWCTPRDESGGVLFIGLAVSGI